MSDTLASQPPGLCALLARTSVPAQLLRDPAPPEAVLELAVAAAMRAPDHGGLRPWRFAFIAGDARRTLGGLMAAALARHDPMTPADRLDLERAKPLRAPLVIAAGAAIRQNHKIPAWEQEASAAAGVMNLLNALDAQGYGAIWLSSPALRDPVIKDALGFAPTDVLLGWVYAGTAPADRRAPPSPDPTPHRRWWCPA